MGKLRIGISYSKKSFKPLAATIAWWDGIRWGSKLGGSHVYGRFTSASWERDFIYQAAQHGTHFMGGHKFSTLNEVREEYELEVPDSIVDQIGQVCVDREGKPYGIKQMVGLFAVNLIWLITLGKLELKNPLADGDTEVNCLEEWGIILSLALGVPMPLDLDGVSITPFRNWLASLPQCKLVYKKEDL